MQHSAILAYTVAYASHCGLSNRWNFAVKIFKTYWVIFLAASFSGCSGLIPSPFFGADAVSPGYIAQFRSGGSLRTLWYQGSDAKWHYFDHYAKVSTNYRVARKELNFPTEFPYQSRKTVSVGDDPIWRNYSD